MNPRAGLSVLELLVALALVGLIAVGLAGTLGFGARVWDRASSLQGSEEPLILRARLRQWLSEAVPPRRILRVPTEFEGNPNGFAFTTLAETPHEPDAAAMRIAVGPDEQRLVLSIQYLDDMGAVQKSERRKLATNVRDVRFAYAMFDSDAGLIWQDTWGTGDAALPLVVRIRTAEGATPPWPEFSVRLLFAVLR